MRVSVEELEPRNLLSIFTPAQIRHAYGFDQVQFGAVTGDGSGQTIAIVDAYDNSRIASDLATFDAAFGLPTATLVKATPQGKPRSNAGWALETSLDVEWAHAIAPGAKILLVEAKSSSFSNLLNAVNYARQQPGVAAVSMSWGADEAFLSPAFESYYDAYFTTPSGHSGVTFVASSGDNGGAFGPEWPAISPNVLSVGGTSLFLDGQGNYSSESAWSGSTGGISFFEPEPSYQQGVQSTGYRTSPDVAAVGDPNTGVYVYTTVSQGGYKGWFQVGGTSLGAPIWAGLVAIADQGRAQIGTSSGAKAALDGSSDTLPALYSLSSTDFTKETSGANDIALATTNYNLATGLGTPKAKLVINDLLKVVSTFPAPSTSGSSAGTSAVSSRSASPHAIVGGQSSAGSVSNTPNSSAVDPAAVIALLRSSSTATLNTPAAARPVTNAPAPPITPTISGTGPVATIVLAPVLPVGGPVLASDSTEDVSSDAPVVVPVKPVNFDMPTGTETPAAPARPMLDILYNDAGSDGHWMGAFADPSAPVLADTPAETGVSDAPLALAVALGGFWMTLAEKPAWRKRPELAN